MKIVFVSNYLNHHQLPFCIQLAKENDIDFTFVATMQIPKFRLALGYEDLNNKYPFVVRAYESDESKAFGIKLATEADVTIIGTNDIVFIEKRLRDNKLTFKMSERLFKESGLNLLIKLIPKTIKYRKLYKKFKEKNFYLLSQGDYSKRDYQKIGLFKNKVLRWGYFPKPYYLQPSQRAETIQILWCGRVIDWKRPMIVFSISRFLEKEKNNFEIKIVGTGDLCNKIQRKIKRKNIKNIELIGPLNGDGVHKMMSESNIFVISSNRREGWGAVLNEAMSHGCICFSNKAVGASTYLINNGVNGFIYRGKKDLHKKLKQYIDFDSKTRINIELKAKETISKIWNGENAAKNLIHQIKFYFENHYFDSSISGPGSIYK